MAQDANEEAVVTGFTGTLLAEGDLSFLPGPDKKGYGPYRFTMDVSDPRRDGEVLNVYLDAPPEASDSVDGPVFHTRTYQVAGDEGAWVGDGGGWRSPF
jgi:hypothetical protein